MAKKILLSLWFSLLLFAILFLFWQNEFKYSLPTPIPQNYHKVAMGSRIDLGKCWAMNNKPVFIHFFNPDCPCSRFNIAHVSGLIKKYGDRINFKIVVLNPDKNFTIDEIQKKFGAAVPVYFDTAMAKKCGVFSTPQAVIIDPSQHLYYRGNYNKTRYCTNADSNYAQMAIDSLLEQTKTPSFDALALRAYGCSLPKCTK
ncbi:peroxiredoxin [Flavobacterium sp. ENC]|uniref:peroxiredoxin family protein n=1 Tax=Flavobacterium sp. ENC TaxID=2897330 RepID=UPI001E3415E0|nr:thioredoxin fold domain-containing protein [Flavobacterium sp. ENC]MCD0465298.1 redoxin domain-containing protein [Flavobacterium sp. ENC]